MVQTYNSEEFMSNPALEMVIYRDEKLAEIGVKMKVDWPLTQAMKGVSFLNNTSTIIPG